MRKNRRRTYEEENRKSAYRYGTGCHHTGRMWIQQFWYCSWYRRQHWCISNRRDRRYWYRRGIHRWTESWFHFPAWWELYLWPELHERSKSCLWENGCWVCGKNQYSGRTGVLWCSLRACRCRMWFHFCRQLWTWGLCDRGCKRVSGSTVQPCNRN